jgi:iron(III) transport system substrate-binding protein
MNYKMKAVALVVIAALASGCAGEGGATVGESKSLVVYSGRNEALIGPLLEKFESQSGVEVKVRYASTSELVATLLEEGEATPADMFLSQDAAALGALSAAGRLRPLSEDLLGRVDKRFRSPAHDWVGVSGRARSVVFAPERIAREELPASLEEIGASRYRGRFGVAPANGSFQAHMAVYRSLHGAEALADLLDAMVANEPGRYPKNSAIVEAVIAGEIDFGLVNHYYLWRAKTEDPSVTAENYFLPAGEASSFINLAGVGALSERRQAETLIEFLLSGEAQQYFAGETFEYPLVAGIEPSVALEPLAGITTPNVDYGAVAAELPEALAAIAASGLLE